MTAAFLLMCGCVWVREREREGHVNWKSNSNFNRKNIEFVRWQQHWHRIQAEKDLTEAALTGAAKNQPSAILHQRTSKFAIWFSQTRSECHQFIIVHNISSPFPDRIFFSCFISPPKIHFIVAIERLNRLTWLVWNPCAGSGTTCPISLLSLSLSLSLFRWTIFKTSFTYFCHTQSTFLSRPLCFSSWVLHCTSFTYTYTYVTVEKVFSLCPIYPTSCQYHSVFHYLSLFPDMHKQTHTKEGR